MPPLDDDTLALLADHRDRRDGGDEPPIPADETFLLVPCRFCEGTGTDAFGASNCPMCDGRGEH